MDAQKQELSTSFGLLVLRLGVGGYLLTHGWGKVQMIVAGNFDKFADPVGLGSGTSLVLMTGAEFLCALLVMFGAATRLAAVPVVIGLAVAALVVHAGDPWTMGQGAALFTAGKAKSWASKEPAFLFLIPFLTLIFTGAGRFSVDALIGARWRDRRESRRAAPRGVIRAA